MTLDGRKKLNKCFLHLSRLKNDNFLTHNLKQDLKNIKIKKTRRT